MKENDPLIVMTHTLIENSAPRPQLYQQVRAAKGFVPHPHLVAVVPLVCCAMLLFRCPHSILRLVSLYCLYRQHLLIHCF